MSRRSTLVVAASGALLMLSSIHAIGHENESATAKATIGKATVIIDYRRPSLKGRDLMKMIHPGDLWRLGADAPTTIESNSDLDFGGTRVAKGKYVLLARYLEPGKWTLVVSTKDRLHYEPSAKLAEVPLQAEEGRPLVEQLKIYLSGRGGKGTIEIAWGGYRLTALFEAAK